MKKKSKKNRDGNLPSTRQENKPIFEHLPRKNSHFGNYVILEEIARGGMGVVYQAREKNSKRIVALKVMKKADRRQLERFKVEIAAISKLSHECIVSIFDSGEVGEVSYFTMEFVEGRTLAEWIKDRVYSIRPAVELIEKIAHAVEHAHVQGIIHRDLKPANIIIDQDGRPRITDFGLARDISSTNRLTKTGTALGTPYYMAPEQIEGRRCNIGHAVDIYALGVILYQLTTGVLPFHAGSLAVLYNNILAKKAIAPKKLNAEISRELDLIILTAMAKKSSNRYPRALDFADDLRNYLENKDVCALQYSAKNTKKWSIGIVVFILMISIIFLIAKTTRNKNQEKITEQKKTKEIDNNYLKSLWQKEKWQELQIALENILDQDDNKEVGEYYFHLAKFYEKQGDKSKAMQVYQRYYVYADHPEMEYRVLRKMLQFNNKSGSPRRAYKMLQSARAIGYPKAKEERSLAADICFQVGEFKQARDYALQDKLPILSWLDGLLPVKKIPGDYRFVHIAKLSEKSNLCQILLMKDNLMNIFQGSDFALVGRIVIPKPMQFTHSIAIGDITGDGQKEIVALVSAGKKRVIAFQKSKDGYRQLFDYDLKSDATELWCGDMGEKRDVIMVAVGAYRRDSLQLRFTNGTLQITKLDPALKQQNTDTLSVDVGDITGDNKKELVLGTADWTCYDLRIYKYQDNGWRLKSRAKLGKVTACKIMDLNGDGQMEIIAAKSNTYNKDVFGEKPWGRGDGIHIFHYQSDRLVREKKYIFEHDQNIKRYFRSIEQAYFRRSQLTALVYSNITKQSPTETISRYHIWMLRMKEKDYRIQYFTRYDPILDYSVGDIDGDGRDELLFLEPKSIVICGVEK